MLENKQLRDAIEAARLAGKLIAANLENRFNGNNGEVTLREKSNEVDLQTQTDIECEKVWHAHPSQMSVSSKFISLFHRFRLSSNTWESVIRTIRSSGKSRRAAAQRLFSSLNTRLGLLIR